ncbi:uncharacterized protein LOC135809328 [Sycon ciliatum]|uniref:uncharacterized protein LOC135809328 n=1 Tax=Sycon ciliatum TaxID=27933 RepID=UPI0031F6C2E0
MNSAMAGKETPTSLRTEAIDVLAYAREPEFTTEELQSFRDGGEEHVENEEEAAAAASVEEAWPPHTRVGNVSWCECTCCVQMECRLDCICCREVGAVLQFLSGTAQRCVSETEEFQTGCLNKHVLTIALRGYLDMTKQLCNQPPTNFDNRSFRYAAYRQVTWMIHGKMGRGVRCRIPACLVGAIRQCFPNPPGVPYHGFEEARDEADTQWPED